MFKSPIFKSPIVKFVMRVVRYACVILVGSFLVLGAFTGFGNWLTIIAALLFMIFMHELGHYLTARWSGMKVTEFFIGFGPRLWSFKRGETEYGIKAIWAGAYVRIIGMNNLDVVDPGDELRSFKSKSYPKKLLVLAAGSGAHFLMAFLLLFTAFLVQGRPLSIDASETHENWTLAHVAPNSAAENAGLQVGDRLISVNGRQVTNFADFGHQVATELKGEEVEVRYSRDGVQDASSQDASKDVQIASNVLIGERFLVGNDGELIIGDDGEPVTVGFFGVAPFYEREKADVFIAAVDSSKSFFELLVTTITTFPSAFASGVLDAAGGILNIWDSGTPTSTDVPVLEDQELNTQAGDDSLGEDESRLLSIYGVARLGAEAASEGTMNIVMLMVFVNIFIGVFNLLPVMPFDGGHIAVVTYERLRSFGGKSYHVDAAKLLPVTFVVIALLVLIGGVTLVRDIIDPFSLG